MKWIAAILCFFAGYWMYSITSQGGQHGEPSIFESAFHGIGIYFWARGFGYLSEGNFLKTVKDYWDKRPL